jgi:hypothetical protein
MDTFESLKAEVMRLQAEYDKLMRTRAELGPKATTEEIRPGMSKEISQRVAGAILRALREDQ